MPNPTFCSFVSNFRHSIDCKKIKFGSVYSVLIEKCLKILIEDGYIKDYVIDNYNVVVEGVPLDIRLKYNSIILYSTSWKTVIVTNKELLKLVSTGGYFILSTPFGVMNDSTARKLKTSGVILMGIF